jgi:hypothetical protein
MSPRDRSFAIPPLLAIALPGLLALGGCVAAPLVQLAAMQGGQPSAPCASGSVACNTGSSESMLSGLAGTMQKFVPGAAATQPGPCAAGMPGCAAPAASTNNPEPTGTQSPVAFRKSPAPASPKTPELASSSQKVAATAPAAQTTLGAPATPCAAGSTEPGCNQGAMATMTQGLATSFQKFLPVSFMSH